MRAGSARPTEKLSRDANAYFAYVLRLIIAANAKDSLDEVSGFIQRGLDDNWFDPTNEWHNVMTGMGATLFETDPGPDASNDAFNRALSDHGWRRSCLRARWCGNCCRWGSA